MAEPVTALAIFAGSWLAKKLARDYANKRRSEHTAVFQAASLERDKVQEKCTALQEKAGASMGRIGIQRIESMRRVLPAAASAARICADRGLDDSAFKGQGWFGGRSHRSLLGLSASLIAVDLVLPEGAPITSAETLLSTLAAQGAYKAFEALPHHEDAHLATSDLSSEGMDSSVLEGVDAVEGGVGKVDDFFGHQDVAKDATEVIRSLDVDEIHSLTSGADGVLANAAGFVGNDVSGAVAEVGSAMDTLGDFIGDFTGPVGWALAGWSIGGIFHGNRKLATKREEVKLETKELAERTERAKRILARGEEIERITPEASYQAFKYAWIMKQVAKKRFRSKGWRERDATRAEKLAKAARHYWHVMNTPVLAKGGDAADAPLTPQMAAAA
ncbi:MAG TPA: hypothetical protein VFV70_05500 [Hyphomonadaceae bacterium]|nr:hypothetical protein [Hyphomonadaceae bacterium]